VDFGEKKFFYKSLKNDENYFFPEQIFGLKNSFKRFFELANFRFSKEKSSGEDEKRFDFH